MTATTGLTGFLSAPDTSSGAVDQTGFDLYHLIAAIGTSEATINGTGEVFASTAFASATVPIAVGAIPGLSSWSASFSGRFPASAPAVGHQGLVTFANGYTTGLQGWGMTLNAGSDLYAVQATTPPSWYNSLPGQISGTGTHTAIVDDTTAINLMTQGAATFRINTESGDDNTLACAIAISGFNAPIKLGSGKTLITYNYTTNGAITAAGDNTLFPAGALVTPDITEIVIRAKGSRTYTGLAHWTSVSIGSTIGSPITASVSVQGSGALAVA